MGQMENLMEIEFEIEDELDRELIKRNHETAELLAKKGYKIKKPNWHGPIAS